MGDSTWHLTCPLLDLASVTGLDPQRVFSLFRCFIYKKDRNCSHACSVLGLRHLKYRCSLGDGLQSIPCEVTGDDIRPIFVV